MTAAGAAVKWAARIATRLVFCPLGSGLGLEGDFVCGSRGPCANCRDEPERPGFWELTIRSECAGISVKTAAFLCDPTEYDGKGVVRRHSLFERLLIFGDESTLECIACLESRPIGVKSLKQIRPVMV